MSRLRTARPVAALALSAALLIAPATAASAAGAHDAGAPGQGETVRGAAYPGDPALESLLIAGEERRLIDVRAIANAAGWTNLNQGRPYRLVTGPTYTLVLIAREAPYTLDDLIELAPSTFVRQPDGAYLLRENIVVEQGATLRLGSEDGLVLRMNSTESSFVSIVTLGGSLEILGTPSKPAEVSSWDSIAGVPDQETSDGRSYIRVTGGHANLSNVQFHHLGFWSGATGGVSLTGTDVPEVLSDNREDNLVVEEPDENPKVYGTELIPAGDETGFAVQPDLDGFSHASAVIRSVSSHDNAFGLFVTSADGLEITDSRFEDNLVDGLVLHRYVANSIIRNSVASRNGVDGFSLTRATTAVVLDRVTAERNGRNGITLEGGPLAEGPSATGTPVGSYGNNEVSNSSALDNGRYGIDVIGGSRFILDGNTVTGHDMGIVVSNDVDTVVIRDNIVEDSVREGIALRNHVTNATVQGNSVVGGEIGIYLRDATGLIDRNLVEEVTNHGITLIGTSGSSVVSNNEVSGSGPSGIDVARAHEVTLDGNDSTGWQATKPLDVILRGIFQPLTVLWVSLGLLLVITAVTSIRHRKHGKHGIRHPYAERKPLSAFSAGVVSPESLGLHPRRETETA
jgi:parallel beta-helix repeat protein